MKFSRLIALTVFSIQFICVPILVGQDVTVVGEVESQPLKSQLKRVVKSLEYLGEPLTKDESEEVDKLLKSDAKDNVSELQKWFDQKVVAFVHINPESRVKVSKGNAKKTLTEQGWSVFLVKVHNQAGVTAPLKVESPNAAPVYKRSTGSPKGDGSIKKSDVENRWMDIRMFDSQPLNKTLSGLEVEYRIVQIFSRDKGKREAQISFNIGQGTQDLGFRNDVAILFDAKPAVQLRFDVIDFDGKPTTGQFVIRDKRGRVYPARSRRLAPDFFFHDQIYRKTDETIALPAGKYDVTFTRGPEYTIQRREITIPNTEKHTESFRLNRWIHMARRNWYSGDHHVHAAGCAHYESPTEGVTPEDMMRHILGEDLNVGCVLSWGPCWYHQKEFFEGGTHQLSRKDYLMRYDVEVSGFPSQHAGHLCLLNLKEDDYVYPKEVEFDFRFGAERGTFKGTKTKQIGEWPSWDLPILKWGKEQGGVVGFSHSGWGLDLPTDDLPNYNMPPFNGIGANEYIVDVCHDVCDFISTVDTPVVWELNIWYHTLNCGYDCRISGETDFPCIYGDRVGLGRVYVKLDENELNFEKWIEGIKIGRSYVGDGLSHLFDFKINDFEMGQKGTKGRHSYMAAKKGESLKVNVQTAALLNRTPNPSIKNRPLNQKPYWHVERSRVGATRKVPVELIVNGLPVQTKQIEADGDINDVTFDLKLERSSWVAVRIFPSSHTNPIFVEVDEKPIRASKRSAKWCLDAVDVCWKQKVRGTRPHEKEAAKKAYDFARESYRKILDESFDDTK